MKVIAVIPARKDSLRLPHKNRRKLLGKPLIEWSVKFAKKLKFVDDIIVSTNDKIIVNNMKKFKIVKTFIRPKNLSGKKASTIDVILHVLKKYERKFSKVDAILLLQPTSPIRSIKKIYLAFKKYIYYKKIKSIISVSHTNFPNKENCKEFFQTYIDSSRKNRLLSLECEKSKNFLYQINGNFYIASPLFLRKYRSFYFKNLTYPIVLNSKSLSIDIDTIVDFKKAEKALKKL